MSLRRSAPLPIGITLAVMIAILAAAPAVADTETGHTGTTGAHSLSDTSLSPGAKCKYHYRAIPDNYKLNRITVTPPRVRAIAGSQKVGWLFSVQRRLAFEGDVGPWETTYSSPIQSVTTDSTHDAAFAQKTVSVIGADPTKFYRVLVKMFWYRSNGTVQGTAVHRVDWYRLADFYTSGPDHYYCTGLS